jgi:copper oxidase (laccase) domain-containing protein
LPKLVQAMRDSFHSHPDDLWAGLSPNLHACCLRLGPEQHQQFSRAWSDRGAYMRQEGDSGFNLSLNDLARFQLQQAGLAAERMEVQAFCTGCNPALFFSHRRDRGRTGRMWTLAGFADDQPRGI